MDGMNSTVMDARRLKKYLPLSFIFLAAFLLAALTSILFVVRSPYLERHMVQTIQQELGYLPSFDRLRISLFPAPVLRLSNLELRPAEKDYEVPLIRAEDAVIRPSLLALFLGRSELTRLSLKNAEIHYTWREAHGAFVKTISLNDVFLELWNIRPNRPIRFKARGKFLSDAENVVLSGVIQTGFKDFRIKDFVSRVQVNVAPVELSRYASWWGDHLPIRFEKGTVSISGEIVKERNASEISIKGSSKLEGLIYQIRSDARSSAAADYEAGFDIQLDLTRGMLTLKDGTLKTPFGGPLHVESKLNVLNGAVDEVYIKSKALSLEVLPRYVLNLEKMLPLNMGFSGQTQLDFFAKGKPELFLINVHVDLSDTTLTYSKYFSKPPGTPLHVRGDVKLAGGRILRGDFSTEFQEATLKGSVVGLDLISGEGEMTILTNKFSIAGWEQYFPPLRELKLSGGAKILASLKGNLGHLREAQTMANITLDGLQATAANGARIQNLSGSLDLGPLDSELKNVQLEIGNTSFSVEGKMFRQPDTRWLIGIQTLKLDVADFVGQLRRIGEVIKSEQASHHLGLLEKNVAQFLSREESFEAFRMQLAFGGGRVLVPELRFDAFGGTVSGRTLYDYSAPVPQTTMELQVDRLSLARMQGARSEPLIEGNLFATATLSGEGPLDQGWLDRLKGEGSASVTNGEFHTLDILKELGEIAELRALGRFKSGATRFHDVRGDFEVEQKKMKTENLILLSEDFEVEGAGDISFNGDLNFRLSVYLAPSLSQKIVPRLDEHMRLGPIPILVVGSVTKPSFHRDPMLIGTFLTHLVQQQFSKITSGIAPIRRLAQPPVWSQRNPNEAKKQTRLDQAFLQSGFNLLDQFLADKKAPSS